MSTQAKRQTAILPPDQASGNETEWKHLEARPDPWRKQLYFKNSRLRPFIVWRWMLANNQTLQEAAENWDLPLEAVEECIRYCESHEELLNAEAAEERHWLEGRGVPLEPPPSR